MTFVARLAEQEDPPIGDELVVVEFDDGSRDTFRLHDYERLYALPGVYEQIVQERLGCRSPAHIAGMLAAAADGCGWDRRRARVIDIAAGNGVSGVALADAGLRPVLGTDIVDAARRAALRDRPGVYNEYLTLDLLALAPAEREAVAALQANILCCVAPVGEHAVPVQAVAAVAALLERDALIGYMHDVTFGHPDAVTGERLGGGAVEIARERYVHRRTVNGAPYEMEGVVWLLRRERPGGR